MGIERIEDIIAWQKAKLVAVEIYTVFQQSNDFAFNGQIQKAAVSIMNNIAEGFERNSVKEFQHFLNVARGSCGEVRSMLTIAKELGKISEIKADELIVQSEEISKIIYGLIKSL